MIEGPNRNERLKPNIESASEKPLFKITLLRHGKALYEEVGNDLTPEGIEEARAAGLRLVESGDLENEEVFLFHSPAARAKGTLEIAAEEAGLDAENALPITQLRTSDIHDQEAFDASIVALAEKDGIDEYEAAAKHHYVDPMHADGVALESHANKQKRLYRTFEYLARWVAHHQTVEGKTPHAIAVSHYELITHIINDVFDITTFDTYRAPATGEAVEISAYSYDEDSLRFVVSFRGQQKEVLFNRKARSIQQL
ncbi:hypothetical protein BH11PAT2_BH11PAT2_07970 [soil metagenome]